jgi:hypothetical protein
MINKELNKFKNAYETYYNNITSIIKNMINKYKTNINYLKNNDIIYNEFVLLIPHVYNLARYIAAFITDLYLTARIMKNNQFNNNIIYVSLAHLNFIVNILTKCEFNGF